MADSVYKLADILSIMLVLSFAVQIVVGLLQVVGAIESFHSLFLLTGTFSNPGPYACYIVCVFPYCFYLYKKSSLVNRIFLTSLLVGFLIVLVFSQSRTAWICMLFLVLANSVVYYKKKITVRLLLISLPIIVLGFLALYYFKKGSADGRFFIWSINLEIIKEHWLLGILNNTYSIVFNDFQSSYFYNTKDLSHIYTAGHGDFPFNEFINITINYGVLGLFLFISILFNHYRTYRDNIGVILCNIAILSLVSILIFSFFSYPFSIVPILHVAIISSSIVSVYSPTIHIFKLNVCLKYIASFFAVIFVVSSIKYSSTEYFILRERERAETYIAIGNNVRAEASMKSIYEKCKDNAEFLVRYGEILFALGKYRECIIVLNMAKRYNHEAKVYILLGKAYDAIGLCNDALKSMIKASNTLPYLFYPRYMIYQLYIEMGMYSEAKRTAIDILAIKIKVHSPVVDEIRSQTKRWLDHYSKLNVIDAQISF